MNKRRNSTQIVVNLQPPLFFLGVVVFVVKPKAKERNTMRTKIPLLSLLAIMTTLPFGANATGPAHDSGNSPVVATASAPYQTVTPEAHADEHIASTKYVIGAYNDAIAAVNKVDSEKQAKLASDDGVVISSEVLGSASTPSLYENFLFGDANLQNEVIGIVNDKLVTARGLFGLMSVFETLKQIPVYTTWDDDTAKTPVALSNITDFN